MEMPYEEDMLGDYGDDVSESDWELPIGWKCPPVIGLRFMKGEEVQIPSAGDRVVVLEYWGLHCQPCIEAIPHMNEIQAKHYERGLRIISLTLDRVGPSDVSRFVKKHGMECSVALINHGRYEAEIFKSSTGSCGVPFAMVIDKKGIVRYAGHPMDEGFEPMIEECLGEENRPPVPLPLISESKDELMEKSEEKLLQILLIRRIPVNGGDGKKQMVRSILAKCTDTVYYE